ncbi:hypothetical protein F5884DRAFT_757705 [Xylogone sp. PMI_703]|nr:hypothetical protein F5884DRAFT_757705 [Xylogone sp. PMI_703]
MPQIPNNTMGESILQSSQSHPEGMILDSERDDASDTQLCRLREVIEYSDETLLELAKQMSIQFDYDGLVLRPEQRQALTKKCLSSIGFGPYNTAPREIREEAEKALSGFLEVVESSNKELVEFAEEIGIQVDYDGSVLKPEQRRVLIREFLAELGCVACFGIREEAKNSSEEIKELSEEEILVDQAEALGKEFDYDPSVLTPEQRQAVFKKYFAMHCETYGIRPPQYYEGKSQCLSVSETAWPGAVAMLKAEKLKRGYIEPEDLIERLSKLKPSNNFELRKFRHPFMSWESLTPLEEEGFEMPPPLPDWLIKHCSAVNPIEQRMVQQCRAGKVAVSYRWIKEWAVRFGQEVNDRWTAVESSVELVPLPDSPLLRDMGHSPGGTLFPWYLVKGLMTLRERADEMGRESYDEEYKSAVVKREEAINRWRESNPDSILAEDPLSIYKTWPADLMDELNEIDREAIRCGRRKYVALLEETEPKMQELVTFWRDCGLITGQRTPPSCWWQDPKAKVKQLLQPQYLTERLKAINTEFGWDSDMAEKLRMIEASRWKESIINGDSEPTACDTSLPQPLLDELDIVWQDRDRLNDDDTEDEMIARMRQWRKSKHQQRLEERLRTTPPQFGLNPGPEVPGREAKHPVCSRQMNLLQDGTPNSVIAPEGMRQHRGKLSRGTRRQSRIKPPAEDQTMWRGRLRTRTKPEEQTTWRDRLRPRSNAVTASRDKTKATNTQTGKPQGIVKRKKASKKRQLARTKGQATAFTTQTANPSHCSTQSYFNEGTSQTVPGNVTKARGTNLRRRSPLQASVAQPQGVQKTHNGNRRQTRRLMTALTTSRLITPPQSG